ncbi:trafficking protein particle complex subunit 6b [Neocloeon triangulifer]|uniref:trafficking protein particle complex subunit 6b n=1 Tax=Neocloeon triangulifer TaxID=2078957 RepID=UPI00286EC26C|nr:trafficking protein particle complex subunit 6b [Neocloeon triangulifer]
MADPVFFEFLHAEIIKYIVGDDNSPSKDLDLSALDTMGFSCGYRIIERLTREWPKFKDELEVVKFICTDFWTAVYGKQIDNLRTNNQGLYVLQDNMFRFLSKISIGKELMEIAPNYYTFTCGLVRGALANLGVVSAVNAEVQIMPSVKFHIQVQRT